MHDNLDHCSSSVVLQVCWRHCNSQTIVRLRRLDNTFEFYRQLYMRAYRCDNWLSLLRAVLSRHQRKRLAGVLAATAFTFQQNSIGDHELEQYISLFGEQLGEISSLQLHAIDEP